MFYKFRKHRRQYLIRWSKIPSHFLISIKFLWLSENFIFTSWAKSCPLHWPRNAQKKRGVVKVWGVPGQETTNILLQYLNVEYLKYKPGRKIEIKVSPRQSSLRVCVVMKIRVNRVGNCYQLSSRLQIAPIKRGGGDGGLGGQLDWLLSDPLQHHIDGSWMGDHHTLILAGFGSVYSRRPLSRNSNLSGDAGWRCIDLTY